MQFLGADLTQSAQSAFKSPAISGDITIAQNGNTAAITAGVIVDADINASAAIALSKLSVLTGLSTSTASAVTATDAVLAAIGKLEARTSTVSSLAAAFSSSSTTRTNVTGWAIPVVVGGVYDIKVLATYQTAATTTGGSIGIVATTAVGSYVGRFYGGISNAAAATELAAPVTASGSSLTTTGVAAIASPHHIGLDCVFVCTTAGTLNIQWGTEVNASAAQLNAGSTLIYQRLA